MNPEEYRWSGYGEAIGAGAKGSGKKARAGLVRAMRAHKGVAADAAYWTGAVAVERACCGRRETCGLDCDSRRMIKK